VEQLLPGGWLAMTYESGNYRPGIELWWPLPPAVRKTQRLKALARQSGLVDYWKAHGWPDLCHPTTGDDFDCN
jgi:hypothetical protein